MNFIKPYVFLGLLLGVFNLSAEEQKNIVKQDVRALAQLPNGESILSWQWDATDQDKMIINTGACVISGRIDAWWRDAGQHFQWQIIQKHVIEALNEFYRLQKDAAMLDAVNLLDS
jgi:hypothetical protein